MLTISCDLLNIVLKMKNRMVGWVHFHTVITLKNVKFGPSVFTFPKYSVYDAFKYQASFVYVEVI